jgi:alpha-tubulin suppressor-like RCC1 family protein
MGSLIIMVMDVGVDVRDNNSGTQSFTSGTSITDQWVKAELTIDADGTITSRRYVDGVLNGQFSFSNTAYSSFDRYYIYGGHDYWVDNFSIRKYSSDVSLSYGSLTPVYGPQLGISVRFEKGGSSAECSNVVFDSSSQIRCVTPASFLSPDKDGPVDVIVTNPSGTTDTSVDGFSYYYDIYTAGDPAYIPGNASFVNSDAADQVSIDDLDADITSPSLMKKLDNSTNLDELTDCANILAISGGGTYTYTSTLNASSQCVTDIPNADLQIEGASSGTIQTRVTVDGKDFFTDAQNVILSEPSLTIGNLGNPTLGTITANQNGVYTVVYDGLTGFSAPSDTVYASTSTTSGGTTSITNDWVACTFDGVAGTLTCENVPVGDQTGDREILLVESATQPGGGATGEDKGDLNIVSTGPQISDITPASGPTTGGTEITITGANFEQAGSNSQGGTSNVIVDLKGGDRHVLALLNDGTIWTWGRNDEGQLGLGDTTNRDTPTQVGSDTNWSGIAATGYTSMGIKSDGTIWTWGRNDEGQLGLGDTTNRDTPTQVGSDTNWSGIGMGAFHTFAIKSDGTLWAWGQNNFGQLGLGDTTNRDTPTQVGSDTNWANITGGWEHTVATRSDGTLWAWGRNDENQLGLGGNTDRNTPTQVGSDTNWVTPKVGDYFTFVTRSDGTLWAWGQNNFGQLGLGDTTNRDTPTQVGSDTNWANITGGWEHTVATRSDGTLWAWGRNDNYQLGLGDTTNRNTPTQVGSDTNWDQLVAKWDHSLASKNDDTLWAWGRNADGTLGVGDTNNRTSLTQVSDFPPVPATTYSRTINISKPRYYKPTNRTSS